MLKYINTVTKNNGSTFFCFSPPVMLATFAIEIGLMLYVLIRYKMSPLTRLVSAALVLLATFQVAEYQVCTTNLTTGLFSKIGYAAITLLPPIGIHIVQTIAGRGSKRITAFAYISAFLFIFFFVFNPQAFQNYECSGNYAIFRLVENAAMLFGIYYYGWLFTGIYLCYTYAQTAKNKAVRLALTYQAFGYLSFIIPTGLVNLINPTTTAAIPSIMCGFAVIYALILALGIMPVVAKSKKSKQ